MKRDCHPVSAELPRFRCRRHGLPLRVQPGETFKGKIGDTPLSKISLLGLEGVEDFVAPQPTRSTVGAVDSCAAEGELFGATAPRTVRDMSTNETTA